MLLGSTPRGQVDRVVRLRDITELHVVQQLDAQSRTTAQWPSNTGCQVVN